MDFEVENQGKSMKQRFKKTLFFPHGFFIDFSSSLGGFGVPNGSQDGPEMGKLGLTKAI